MKSRLVSREALSEAEEATMLALLSSHFHGVTPDRFAADLEDKNWVLLLEDESGIRGFSTLSIYETAGPGGEPLTVVYSGDTIMEQGAWSTAALPKSWIAAVRALGEKYSRGRLIWLLLTSGFRTYRFLPVFWRDFWPRHDDPMPAEVRELRDHLASGRFEGWYRDGIVRFPEPGRRPIRARSMED